MAKTSAIQKNLKRIKMVKKYANKRAALKKIIKNKKLELSERFAAQLKLNKLPKNSSKIRIRINIKKKSPQKYECFLEDLFLGSQWSIILGYRRLSVKFLYEKDHKRLVHRDAEW